MHSFLNSLQKHACIVPLCRPRVQHGASLRSGAALLNAFYTHRFDLEPSLALRIVLQRAFAAVAFPPKPILADFPRQRAQLRLVLQTCVVLHSTGESRFPSCPPSLLNISYMLINPKYISPAETSPLRRYLKLVNIQNKALNSFQIQQSSHLSSSLNMATFVHCVML